MSEPPLFTLFKSDISAIGRPERFCFPFHYQPHLLARVAAEELQQYLLHQRDFDHPFWQKGGAEEGVYGKMFGVLIAEDTQGRLGYLQAFSGKLAGALHHRGFVPPVFDMLDEAGFFRTEERKLSALNRQIASLEKEETYLRIAAETEALKLLAGRELEAEKLRCKTAKNIRDELRKKQNHPEATAEQKAAAEAVLTAESQRDHYRMKDLKKTWKLRLAIAEEEWQNARAASEALREYRRQASAALQQRLFSEYFFLNSRGEKKNIADVFGGFNGSLPPSGAGECAAPKLLQYAYAQGLKPITMAEFWWGESPMGEVRHHGHYYPACKSKCEPILSFMLQGVEMDPNPVLQTTEADIRLQVRYEDGDVLVVHKPASLLSVPGKTSAPSVAAMVRSAYPLATGPLIVHRLDWSTSGLMIIAKNEKAYHHLQNQFLHKLVKKTYLALLAGSYPGPPEGEINLPLRPDIENRPRQIVCHQWGKPSHTRYRLLGTEGAMTRILFYPQTGRTHQLRVHASHPAGLNMPIAGDDLYGQCAERLCLQALEISFFRPGSGELITVRDEADF